MASPFSSYADGGAPTRTDVDESKRLCLRASSNCCTRGEAMEERPNAAARSGFVFERS